MNLKINSITKKFGEKVIFDNFSYFFEQTGLYVITGESGIGKTTLLRIIAGLDKDYTGEVDGAGIGNVSVMFQEYRLFPSLNALKNAAISLENSQDAEALLKRLGFADEDLRKRPSHLSGGMKQRVAFARAVLMDSPILILDEPTKELDPESIAIMLDVIREEAAKRLVIAVTHDEAVVNSGAREIIRI
jgi:ABC-type multidrug transport system ATPase subunit